MRQKKRGAIHYHHHHCFSIKEGQQHCSRVSLWMGKWNGRKTSWRQMDQKEEEK